MDDGYIYVPPAHILWVLARLRVLLRERGVDMEPTKQVVYCPPALRNRLPEGTPLRAVRCVDRTSAGGEGQWKKAVVA
jgi:hypothetical protein